MILSTSASNKFPNTTTKLSIINSRLVKERGISIEDVSKIKKLHDLRHYLFDLIHLSNNKEDMRKLASLTTQLNFQLQRLWKFPEDETKHRLSDIPKCSCQSYNFGLTGPLIAINEKDCIIHGD